MKRFATILITLVCIASGGVYWLDLVNYTNLSTGFVNGDPWIRYAMLGMVLLLVGLASLLVPRRTRFPTAPSPVQGMLCIPTGLAFAVLGGMRIAAQFMAQSRADQALTVLYLITAVWYFLLGLAQLSESRQSPTGSAIVGVVGTLSFYLLTIRRFCLAPTGVARVSSMLASLAALAVLLYGAAQVRSAYVPAEKGGTWLYFTGMSCFLLAACLALPGAVCAFMVGEASVIDLAEAIALGFVGLCGLTSAWEASSRPAVKKTDLEEA